MRHVSIRLLLNIALVIGIGITLGARTAKRPIPIERQGVVSGNAVALSIELPRGASYVVLLVDEDAQDHGVDGRVDRGFLLQGVRELKGGLVLDLKATRVTWNERAVGVWRAGTGVLDLRVGQVGEARAEDEIHISGSGLSHSTAWDFVGIPIDGGLTPKVLADLRTEIVAVLDRCDEFECRGGGPGSMGCEYNCAGEKDPCVKTCEEEEGYACCGCGTDKRCCAECRE